MPPQNEIIVLPNGTVTVVEMIEEMRVEHSAFVFTERVTLITPTIFNPISILDMHRFLHR